ncbi:hypothetical protein C8R45DRAFT_947256 [Mycena sanguinolenta]|nr:hypothetical protein C8R45DRAFT_947256 [Mycena sanguinolenta]
MPTSLGHPSACPCLRLVKGAIPTEIKRENSMEELKERNINSGRRQSMRASGTRKRRWTGSAEYVCTDQSDAMTSSGRTPLADWLLPPSNPARANYSASAAPGRPQSSWVGYRHHTCSHRDGEEKERGENIVLRNGRYAGQMTHEAGMENDRSSVPISRKMTLRRQREAWSGGHFEKLARGTLRWIARGGMEEVGGGCTNSTRHDMWTPQSPSVVPPRSHTQVPRPSASPLEKQGGREMEPCSNASSPNESHRSTTGMKMAEEEKRFKGKAKGKNGETAPRIPDPPASASRKTGWKRMVVGGDSNRSNAATPTRHRPTAKKEREGKGMEKARRKSEKQKMKEQHQDAYGQWAGMREHLSVAGAFRGGEVHAASHVGRRDASTRAGRRDTQRGKEEEGEKYIPSHTLPIIRKLVRTWAALLLGSCACTRER